MNTPNKLTIARMIATPIFMFFMLADFIPFRFTVALVLFAAASITDYIDGNMARKQNIVTNFGKFLDPLADKMLTTAAFIGLMSVGAGRGMSAVLFIVLFREFLVSSLRLVTVSSGGKVVAANIWGKLKTVTQMVSIIFALFNLALGEYVNLHAAWPTLNLVITALIWISTHLCAISGAIYLFECKEFIDPRK